MMGWLLLRNLRHFWRTNLAVVAGVATSVAVLSGALLVGQSVRDSLRTLLFERIGATEFVVSSDRFFREDLAGAVSGGGDIRTPDGSCPIVALQGVVVREGSGDRAWNVNIYGIDERFWRFHGVSGLKGPDGRAALVGSALADRLRIRAGDAILVSIDTQHGVPRESLYGRRDSTVRTTRLVCGEVLPSERLGEFALRPTQGSVDTVFVPLQRLQQVLAQPRRANAILLAPRAPATDVGRIRAALKAAVALEDAGVILRPLPSRRAVSVESSRILLDDATAEAAIGAAADMGLQASGIFTYLANAIRARGREIPYSVITAVDLGQDAMPAIPAVSAAAAVPPVERGGSPPAPPGATAPPVWLNEWAARDLDAAVGNLVEIDYYRWQEPGGLATKTASFRLAGVFPVAGDLDTTLAPEFPGITGARSLRAWDPPFPLDLRRIRPKDEEYWERYRAAPKAIVGLAAGQDLWQSRFGRLTAVRIAFPDSRPRAAGEAARIDEGTLSDVADRLKRRLDPERVGFTVTAVKARGLDASHGSTDFGEYFVYFSFFLIVAAMLLSALFFRLGVEQRAREIGTLLAVGYRPGTVRRLFLAEGAILSTAGSLIGAAGAVAYGGLLVLGLRTWWIGAVGTRHLRLHISWGALGVGTAVGVIVASGAIAWTLAGLGRNSPRALLAGALEPAVERVRRGRLFGLAAAGGVVAAAVLLAAAARGSVPDVAGFFAAGALLLASTLCTVAAYLRRRHPHDIAGRGWRAQLRLGGRNAAHRPGRSVLCVALIALASFVIVSVEAFRKDPRDVSLDPASGTGGFSLLATATLPIVHDPNSAAGREALGIAEAETGGLPPIRFVPFRERAGDDASCLNLYAPGEPRILGAPHAFLASARFSFQSSLASTPEQERNPWLLIESPARDGTIPAIADANTIQYILHLAVGDVMTVRGDGGMPVRLRLVAALRDSILQGELVIAESQFLRAFPEEEGHRFFLLEVPENAAAAVSRRLTDQLAGWGVNVERTRDRLAAYHRVENTYLSTFQSLGGLGLLLGTVGLATVLLRNVLERRKELAFLRAVGYRRSALSVIVVAENILLMICGLACGTISALVAIVPAVRARGGMFPAEMVGLLLVAVLVVGVLSSLVALAAAFRAPLLGSLRSE